MRLLLPSLLLALAACTPSYGDNDKGAADRQAAERGDGPDNDGDGVGASLDCDDTDDEVYPGAVEDPANEIDDDCDGAVDCDDPGATLTESCFDGDGDGWCKDLTGSGNLADSIVFLCNVESDQNAALIAAATGGNADAVSSFIPVEYGDYPDYALPEIDCDDAVSTVSPGAEEVCDEADVDEDCDGGANGDDPDDEVSGPSVWYHDMDLDSYGGDMTSTACEAPEDYVAVSGDCNDDNAAVHPGATEVCDAEDIDEDCDTYSDDLDPEGADGSSTWYDDTDGDGAGDPAIVAVSCDGGEGWVASSDDCNVADNAVYPGAAELCENDGTDNDCDGDASEDPVDQVDWYSDFDGDAWGDGYMYTSCSAPGSFVSTTGDCDDTDDSVYPGATELSDGIDNDCDESVDEDAACTVSIQILEDGGEATSVTGVVSDNSALDGDWLSGVSGVSVAHTGLGGSDHEYVIELGVCVSTTGSIVLDGWFASGESLADDPVANVFAWMDSTALVVSTHDNGDGTYSYAITR